MKKKTGLLVLSAALGAMLFSLGAFTACSKDGGEPKDYTFTQPEITNRPAPDEGITIDGVLNEEAYTSRRWIHGVKVVTQNPGDDTSVGKDFDVVTNRLETAATVDMTAVIGENGIYVGVTVDEGNGIVYMNSDRASYMNSCAELYIALPGATDIKDAGTMEIDIMPDGTVKLKKNYANNEWNAFPTTYDKAAYAAATTDGTINIDAHSYTVEFFLPWSHIDLVQEGASDLIKQEREICMNLAPITSYSVDGTTESDRWWWMLGSQLDDGSWGNVEGWYHFNDGGLMSYDISIADDIEHGAVMELLNYNWAAANNSVTFLSKADDGYVMTDLTVNGVSYKDRIEYQNTSMTKAAVTIPASVVTENLSVDATFTEVGSEPVQVNATVSGKKLGETVSFADGTKIKFDGATDYEFTLKDSAFTGEIVPGVYTVTLSGEGTENYGSLSEYTILSGGNETEIAFPYNAFSQYPGTKGEISNTYANEANGSVTLVSGDSFPATVDSYGDSAFTATLKLSQAEQNNGHFVRYIFPDGTAVQPYVKWKGDDFIVEWVAGTNWGTTSAAGGNWDTVTLPASFGEAFDSDTGVDLTVVRQGLDFYVIVSVSGQPETAVLSHKLTVDEKYQEEEGRWAIVIWDQKDGAQVPFRLTTDTQDIADLLSVDVNVTKTGNGSVTVENEGNLTVNDTVSISVAPDSGYVLVSLTVNGTDVTSRLVNGTYTLSKQNLVAFATEYKVEAVFAAAETVNVDFTLEPVVKLGSTVDLNGETLVFEGGGKSIEAVVSDNAASAELYNGIVYNVSVKGNAGFATLSYTADSTTTESVLEFTYDVFTANLIGSGSGAIDDSHANEKDGYVSASAAGTIWAVMNEASMDSAFTVTFCESDKSEGYFITAYVFDDKSIVVPQITSKNGVVAIQWRIWIGSFGFDDSNVISSHSWEGALLPELNDAYTKGDGIDVTMIRDGLNIYVLVSAHGSDTKYYFDTFTLNAKYEDVAGHWAFGTEKAVKGAQFEIAYTDDAAAIAQLTKLSVVIDSSENGTVTVENMDSLVVGESFEISVEAKPGYTLTSFTVNGEPVSLTDGKYTFSFPQLYDISNQAVNALQTTVQVKAVFEQAEAASVTASVAPVQRLGATVDLEEKTLVFKAATHEVEGVVENGKVTVSLYEGMEYTVSVKGESYYGSVTIVAAANMEEPIAFTYDAFTQSLLGTESGNIDDSQANAENGYVTNVSGVSFFPTTNETFGDSVFTVNFKLSQATKNNRAFIRYIFEDKKALMPSVKLNNDGLLIVEYQPDSNWGIDSLRSGWYTVVLDEAFAEAFQSDTGVDLTLVRNGLNFYTFISIPGTETIAFYDMFTADGSYADQEGHWAISIWDSADGKDVAFSISEDAETVAAWVNKAYFNVTASVDGSNGTVELSADKALLGGSVTVTVTASEGYIVDTVLVGGADKTAELSGGKLTVSSSESKTINVVVSFKEVTEVTIGADVSATRFGEDFAIPDGTEILFEGAASTTLTVQSGVVSGNIAPGTYTMQLQGIGSFASVVVTVSADGKLTIGDGTENAVAFIYDTFEVVSGQVDDSHENDKAGYLTSSASGDMWAVANDYFGDSAITVTVQQGDFTGEYVPIGYVFDDGKFVLASFKGSLRLEWRDDFLPFGWSTSNLLHSSGWNGSDFKNLSDAFAADGVDVTLVRDGLNFYLFISAHGSSEKYLATKITISDAYASQQGHWAFGALGATENAQFGFSFAEDAAEVQKFTKLNVIVEPSENGTVTVENQENLSVADKVKITVSPAEGYILGTLSVNGNTVVSATNNGSAFNGYEYSLPNGNSTNVTVSATFVQTSKVSATAAVSPVMVLGASDDLNGKTLVFKGGYETVEATVADGSVTAQLYDGIEYTVSVKDEPLYGSVKIVAAAAVASPIAFAYDAFTNTYNGQTGSALDETHANDANGYIVNGNGEKLLALTNDSFGNSVATMTVQTSDFTGDNIVLAFVFENGKVVFPGVKPGARVEWRQIWGEFGFNNDQLISPTDWSGVDCKDESHKTAMEGDGVNFTVVRSGRNFYIFLSVPGAEENAVLYLSFEAPEEYAEMQGRWLIGTTSAVASAKVEFSISEDADTVASWVAKAQA